MGIKFSREHTDAWGGGMDDQTKDRGNRDESLDTWVLARQILAVIKTIQLTEHSANKHT
jgi:hypothetical protein